MRDDLLKIEMKKEREKTRHDRFTRFAWAVNYLLCELDPPANIKDLANLDAIKQCIIVYALRSEFQETDAIYLNNMKHQFYNALEKIEKNHPSTKQDILIIKMFMEDFYFNKK